jgi:hypothetical protein
MNLMEALDRIEKEAIAHQHSQILHQIICDLIDEIRLVHEMDQQETKNDKAD